jgi:hypothetical protein
MKKIGISVFIALVIASITSCKKYEEDKFFSTYTAKGRLVNKGVWQIVEVEDLLTGMKFNPIIEKSNFIRFKSDKTYRSYYSTEFTQILKPVFLDQMQNTNDSIYLGYRASLSDTLKFDFANKKNELNLIDFVSFGDFSGNYFNQNKKVNLRIKILKLEFGEMKWSLNDRIIFKLKKFAKEDKWEY